MCEEGNNEKKTKKGKEEERFWFVVCFSGEFHLVLLHFIYSIVLYCIVLDWIGSTFCYETEKEALFFFQSCFHFLLRLRLCDSSRLVPGDVQTLDFGLNKNFEYKKRGGMTYYYYNYGPTILSSSSSAHSLGQYPFMFMFIVIVIVVY